MKGRWQKRTAGKIKVGLEGLGCGRQDVWRRESSFVTVPYNQLLQLKLHINSIPCSCDSLIQYFSNTQTATVRTPACQLLLTTSKLLIKKHLNHGGDQFFGLWPIQCWIMTKTQSTQLANVSNNELIYETLSNCAQTQGWAFNCPLSIHSRFQYPWQLNLQLLWRLRAWNSTSYAKCFVAIIVTLLHHHKINDYRDTNFFIFATR